MDSMHQKSTLKEHQVPEVFEDMLVVLVGHDIIVPNLEIHKREHMEIPEMLLLDVLWPSAVLGQRFRGHIHCAVLDRKSVV